MNDVLDFKKYKQALVIAFDLEAALQAINLSINVLKQYKKYSPVQEILGSLEDNKTYLKIHLNNQKAIIKNKGKPGELE